MLLAQETSVYELMKGFEGKNDLLAEHPEIAKELHEDLKSWCVTLDPPKISSVASKKRRKAHQIGF